MNIGSYSFIRYDIMIRNIHFHDTFHVNCHCWSSIISYVTFRLLNFWPKKLLGSSISQRLLYSSCQGTCVTETQMIVRLIDRPKLISPGFTKVRDQKKNHGILLIVRHSYEMISWRISLTSIYAWKESMFKCVLSWRDL